MIRLILVGWLITFCWIQSVDSTNTFIKNLLTTTPSSNHISDFRKQRRTDSRADRPDTFPGFDLHEDSPTLSPRKRRRQAYSQLIRLFLQNTRDRLETIRDVIKDESELHFRLAQPMDDDDGESNDERMDVRVVVDNENDSMMHNAKIRFSKNENEKENTKGNDDAKNRQFIDFAFADTTNVDGEIIEMDGKGENLSRDIAREYLNSLFAAVGYSRITATPSPTPPSLNPNNERAGDTTQGGDIIAKYFIIPLQSVWNATLERFNLNNENNGSGSVNANGMGARTNNKTVTRTSSNDNQTSIYRVNFVNNSDIKPKMHANARNDMNKEPNEIRVDNFNYSLPLIQFAAANNVTTDDMPVNETTTTASTMPTTVQLLSKNANKINVSDAGMLDVDYVGVDHSGSSDKKPRNTASARTSTEQDAAIAFQNAFLKYSNYMQQQKQQQQQRQQHHSMEYAKRNTTSHAENIKFTQDNRNEMKSSKLVDGGFFTDNLFDGMNSSHIQVVASNKKQKANGSLNENVNSNANSDSDDNGTELNVKSFGEHAGILILEIFGTIVGMTWRAVNDIPRYLWSRNQQTNA